MKNEDSKTLERNEINHRKEEKWSLEEGLVELKPTKPSECFMHLQEKITDS